MNGRDGLMGQDAPVGVHRVVDSCCTASCPAGLLRAAAFAALRPPWLRLFPGLRTVTFMPLLQPVEIVRRDDFARLHPFHGGDIAIGGAHRDGAHGDRLVGLHHVHKGALGVVLDGRRGNQRGPVLRAHQQSRIDELAWEKGVVLVGKEGPELDGAGRGVNLVVHREERPGRQLCSLARGRRPRPPASGPGSTAFWISGRCVFRDAEDHGDGLKLGNHRQGIGIGGMDNVAGVHQAQPNASGNGRGDVGVDDLQLGRIHLALVKLHGAFVLVDGRHLGIELLLRGSRCCGKQSGSAPDQHAHFPAAPGRGPTGLRLE